MILLQSLESRGNLRSVAIASILAALCGCSDNAQENAKPLGEKEQMSWAKGVGQCYWELPNQNGSTRLAAWVLADLDGGTGTALAFTDSERFPNVPIGDNLSVRLIANRDRSRSSITRGFHPSGQGAYMLSVIFGPSQRLAVSGATEISIEFGGRVVARVTTKGFPSLKELASCDGNR